MDRDVATPHWHQGRRERMKDRFFRNGFEGMAPHEVLEMLLYSTISRADTNELAHRLLKHFDNRLSLVLDAPYEELLTVEGVGEKTALMLKMLAASTSVYLTDRDRLDGMVTQGRAGEYLIAHFAGKQTEEMVALCLDSRNRFLGCGCVAKGTVNGTPLQMRSLLETVLRWQTTVVILGHNHPNGLALPSNEDIVCTQRAERVLAAAGIVLLDHLVVAEGDYVSLAQSNLLARQKNRSKNPFAPTWDGEDPLLDLPNE